MATDLTIVESVGEALTNWTPSGSALSVGQIVSGLSNIVTNVSTAVDSVKSLVKNNTPEVDSIAEQQEVMTDLLEENTASLMVLNDSINNLADSIDTFMGLQYFMIGTFFSIVFAGFITTRIKRLFTWRKIKKSEGLM